MIFLLFSKLDCPPVARLAASKRSRSLSFLDLCAESAVPCKRGNFSKCRQFYVLPLAFHHIKRLGKSKRENSERLGLPIRFCFFCAVKRFRFYEDSEAQLFFPLGRSFLLPAFL